MIEMDTAQHLLKTITESCEDFLHVTSFLHRDDAHVILFIHPDKEIFCNVMPGHYRDDGIYLSEEKLKSMSFSHHIPLASGQSRAMLEANSKGDTGLSKRR